MTSITKKINDLPIGEPLLHLRVLKVKSLKKTALREFKTKKSEDGKLFNAFFIDEEGPFIEAVSFIEKKYDQLIEMESYDIQKFELKKPE